MRITCEKVETGLSDYIDAALPPDELESYRKHLEDCEECGETSSESAEPFVTSSSRGHDRNR